MNSERKDLKGCSDVITPMLLQTIDQLRSLHDVAVEQNNHELASTLSKQVITLAKEVDGLNQLQGTARAKIQEFV